MDHRKKLDESVNFQKKINRAFPKNGLSFLCASSNERDSEKLRTVEFEKKYKLKIREYKELNNRKLEAMIAGSKAKLVTERGITLLALIITVVIIIILAVVTINVTLGDGGLVDQAKWAADQTANSTQSEQEQLANVASQINDIIAGIGSGGSDTNSTGGEDTNQVEETNSVDTNSVDTNSVEETNSIDTNTIDPEPDPIPDGTITIGDPQWNGDGTADVPVSSSESEYIIQYQINGTDEGSWLTVQGGVATGVKHGDTVYARITDGEQYSNPQNKKIEDTIPPQVSVTAQGSPSTNSITVTAQANDSETGMVASPTYTFQIKQSGQGSYKTPSGAENISNTTYTFTGLTQGTSYDIQVIVNGDVAGNTGTGTLTNQTTTTVPGADEGLETGNITASPVEWDNYKASTTLTTNTSFKIQYQINGVNEGSWSEAANSPVTVSNLDHGDTVYARLTDGVNAGDYAAINIIDGIAPTVSVEVGEVTYNSIEVIVDATDNESGLADSNAYRYYLNDEEAPRATIDSNTYTYEGLTGSTDYTIKVEVVDKGNTPGTGTAQATTEEEPELFSDIYESTAEYTDSEGNKAWIPGGFAVGISDSINKISQGLVITDKIDENHESIGNQFVWIPTGEYNVPTSINASGKLTNNLSRRTFTTTEATEVSGDDGIQDGSYYYYGEGNSSSVASGQIGAFKASAESTANGGKGGFYIGRYEVGTEEERTSEDDPLTMPIVQANKYPYVYITRDQAKSQIEAMYSSNNNVESELISSYAWDTALNFICQTNVGSGEGYNLSRTTSSQYGNIGTNKKENTGAYVADNYSNIHDLLGNCYEWTTEYYSNSNGPCVIRGGIYNYSYYCAAFRNGNNTSFSNYYLSARAQLYVK